MPQFKYSPSLTEETRELLKSHFPKEERDTANMFRLFALEIGCSKTSLELFRDGFTKSPKSDTVQTVYERLTGQILLTAA